jgi:serine/threonine-protein kinase
VSPEQAEGASSIDHRTDIWSLGVIAFECLLGRPPFVAESFGSSLLAICSRPLPVPSEHGPVPRGFDEWFARACARAAEQRFQSAREASRELRRLLDLSDGESGGSGSGPAPGRVRAEDSRREQLNTLASPASSVPFEPTALVSSAPIASRSVARRGRWLVLAAALGLATLALVARSCAPAPRAEPAREVLAQQPLEVPGREVPRPPTASSPVTPAPAVAPTVEAAPASAAAPKPAPNSVPRPAPAPERRPQATQPSNVSRPPAGPVPVSSKPPAPTAIPSINLGLIPPEQSR